MTVPVKCKSQIGHRAWGSGACLTQARISIPGTKSQEQPPTISGVPLPPNSPPNLHTTRMIEGDRAEGGTRGQTDIIRRRKGGKHLKPTISQPIKGEKIALLSLLRFGFLCGAWDFWKPQGESWPPRLGVQH